MVPRIWTAVIPPPIVNEPLVHQEMRKVPAERSRPIIRSMNAFPPCMIVKSRHVY